MRQAHEAYVSGVHIRHTCKAHEAHVSGVHTLGDDTMYTYLDTDVSILMRMCLPLMVVGGGVLRVCFAELRVCFAELNFCFEWGCKSLKGLSSSLKGLFCGG